ncbi:hypothetical protein ES708_26211 [subsurface metagenome]
MNGKALERKQKWRAEHHEEKLGYDRLYRQKHNTPEDKARRALYAKQYRQSHKDELAHYTRQYFEAHKEKLLSLARQYRQEHKEESRQYHRDWIHNLKQKILTHYGNGKLACVKCGFSDISALTIDHISGDGNKHRRDISSHGGASFYKWLKKNNYPEGYQTLCMNCQFIKKHGVEAQERG